MLVRASSRVSVRLETNRWTAVSSTRTVTRPPRTGVTLFWRARDCANRDMGLFRDLGQRAERLKRDVEAAADEPDECPECGAEFHAAYEECPECGADLEE